MKIIENLLQKAEQKGFASVNGRIIERDFGYVYKGDLEEKYSIKIIDNTLTFKHWGTVTLVADLSTDTIVEWYGESVSDRDSLNNLIDLLGIKGKFHYYPSKDLFTMEEN